jgi:hypothetical protein
MENRPDDHSAPVANPGRSGVFLFPNASTSNVNAFTPFPFPPGGRLYVGHVFPFPFSRPAVASLPYPFIRGRRRPLNVARKLLRQKTGVDDVGRPSFRPLPVRPKTSAVPGRPFPYPGRRTAVMAVLSPFMRSTPTVGRQTPTVDPDGRRWTPIPTPDDPGRPRSDGRRRPVGRSRRSTTVDDDGRRPTARNRNGGLRI